jgi:DNA-binding winged helix-turn-helix (wHTH) protein
MRGSINQWEIATMNAETIARGFAFGSYRLLPWQRLLMERDQPVKLGSRALELLTVLVENPGEIVGKAQLMTRVWPDNVVDEAALRVHMAALRKILGDGRDGRRFIATVPQRGYSFVAPVRPISAPSSPVGLTDYTVSPVLEFAAAG